MRVIREIIDNEPINLAQLEASLRQAIGAIEKINFDHAKQKAIA
jgi:hypothetical protein